jgi:TPR repeat protein
MRWLSFSTLLFLACATTHPVDPLPCSDGNTARCLEFARFVETSGRRDGSLSVALERYCLEGSLESCQQLAKLRGDRSLDQLCQDGITEACPIPSDKRAPEALRVECERRLPNACRVYLDRIGVEKATPADLERGCSEGLAQVCYVLSTRLDATQAERAKKLLWRSCLAGVKDACLQSDVGATKCAQGNGSACRAFFLTRSEPKEVQERKVTVLKQACAHKLSEACHGLLLADMPRTELLALACGTRETCWAVMRGWEKEELAPLCRDAQGLQREVACEGLLRADWPENQPPEYLTTWARARCQSATTERARACAPWLGLLEGLQRSIEWTRVQCEIGECKDKDALASVDRCLGGEKGEICARAGLWLRSLRLKDPEELKVSGRVLTLACASNEALSCLDAAAQEKRDPLARLALYERACRAGSKQGCARAAELSVARRACDEGHCSLWANEMGGDANEGLFEDGAMPPEGLALLEKTCAKGALEDCSMWAKESSAATRVRQCVEKEAFCPPFERRKDKADVEVMRTLRPKFTVGLKACESRDGAACAELLRLMNTTGYFAPKYRSDAVAVKWANTACDAGLACTDLIELLQTQRPQTPELVSALHKAMGKACAADDGASCGDLADALWNQVRRSSRDGSFDRMTPELKQALAVALKGCDLGNFDSCMTAANFVESGIGVAADELQAERLRAKARDKRR